MTRLNSLARAVGAALLGTSLVAGWLLGPALKAAPDQIAAPLPPNPAPPSLAAPRESSKFVVNPRYENEVLGRVQITQVLENETLSDIARRFSVGYVAMHRANPKVHMWVPRMGRKVVVPTEFILPQAPHRGILVNVAAMRLFYFPRRRRGEDQVIYTYPVGIGRVGWKTPDGLTRIIAKVKDPTWVVPKSILAEHRRWGEALPHVVRPGPHDPLGTHALFLGWPGYLIHGTNKPVGVGMRVSHGCVHLYPEDIAQLFKMVPVGTPVRVVNQPYVFGWHRGDLYFEAFGALKDDRRPWSQDHWKLLHKLISRRIAKQLREQHESVNWNLVIELARHPRGVPVAVTDPGASLKKVLADAPVVVNQLPVGSAWNGKSDLPMSQKTFQHDMSKIDASIAASHDGAPGRATRATAAL